MRPRGRKAGPWVIAALMAAGAASVALRVHERRREALGESDGLWRLTYDVRFEAANGGAKVLLAVPVDTDYVQVFQQNLSYPGLTAERLPAVGDRSRVSLAASRAGGHAVTARFDLSLRRRPRQRVEPLESQTGRDRWLRATPTIQAASPAVTEALATLHREPAWSIDPVRLFFDFCRAEVESDPEGESPDDAEGVLNQRIGTPLGRARAFAALCRADRRPARLVSGFEIAEQADASPRTWVEVLRDGLWEPYDLERGFFRQLPRELVPVRRDGVNVVFATADADTETTFSMARLNPGGFSPPSDRSPGEILDLARLPRSMHEALSVMLLLPLGALVTAVFHTVVGVRTIGVFSPTLIALSFVLADWRAGLLVFVIVIAAGLAGRSLLDRLRLLMVPRLGFMLTMVVACLVFTISFLDFYRLTPSPEAVLLPMVILTMTIERFYLASAEDGPAAALKLLLGTVVVASACYLTLAWRSVGALLLSFPELHFFTLGAMVLLGRYTGYRLSELWRFRGLADAGGGP